MHSARAGRGHSTEDCRTLITFREEYLGRQAAHTVVEGANDGRPKGRKPTMGHQIDHLALQNPPQLALPSPPPPSAEHYNNEKPQVRQVILAIIGGGSSGCSSKRQRREYTCGVNHIEATGIHRQAPRWANTLVTFTSDDSEGVKFPHSDTLVISANITEVEVRRVLVDGGSSVDLLFIHDFNQLCIPWSQLSPTHRPNRASVHLRQGLCSANRGDHL